MLQFIREYEMHAGFVVGATGSVIVKLDPGEIADTYGGSNDAMFTGAGLQSLPVVRYVKEKFVDAVTAVVLTVSVVAPAATWTIPAGAAPQFAGENVEEHGVDVAIAPATRDGGI